MKNDIKWLTVEHMSIKKSLVISHSGHYTEIEDVESFIEFTKPLQIGLVDEIKSQSQVLFVKIDVEVYELMILESIVNSEVGETLYKTNMIIMYNEEKIPLQLEYTGTIELFDYDNEVYLTIS